LLIIYTCLNGYILQNKFANEAAKSLLLVSFIKKTLS